MWSVSSSAISTFTTSNERAGALLSEYDAKYDGLGSRATRPLLFLGRVLTPCASTVALIAQAIDRFVSHHGAARFERDESMCRCAPWTLGTRQHGSSTGQCLARQLGHHLAGRLPFAARDFFRAGEDVVVEVESGTHGVAEA